MIDIPCPEGFAERFPDGHVVDPVLYANCLIMNKRVVIPAYDQAGLEKYNDEALEAYSKALPGYKIIPIDVSILTNEGGGIYCSAKEIPDIS